MKISQAVVAAAFINQLGALLSFAALIMLAQSYGSHWSVLCLLIFSVPPILFAKPIAQVVVRRSTAHGWLILNAALAGLTVLVAAVAPALTPMLVILAAIAILRAAAAALNSSLVTEYVPTADRPATFTQLGSVSAVALILGPLVSAYLYKPLGISILLLIDAVTYLLAMGCIWWVTRRHPTTAPSNQPKPTQPIAIPVRQLWPIWSLWLLLGLAGATFDAGEFPFLADVSDQNPSYFGLAMASYGVGGGIVFCFANQLATHAFRWWLALLMYLLGLGLVLTEHHHVVLVGLTIMGAGYGYFNGWLRWQMDQHCAAAKINPVHFWSHAVRLVLLTNVLPGTIAYGYFRWVQNPAPALFIWAAAALTAALLTTSCWYHLRGHAHSVVAERNPQE